MDASSSAAPTRKECSSAGLCRVGRSGCGALARSPMSLAIRRNGSLTQKWWCWSQHSFRTCPTVSAVNVNSRRKKRSRHALRSLRPQRPPRVGGGSRRVCPDQCYAFCVCAWTVLTSVGSNSLGVNDGVTTVHNNDPPRSSSRAIRRLYGQVQVLARQTPLPFELMSPGVVYEGLLIRAF
jgi:hypothetical protein